MLIKNKSIFLKQLSLLLFGIVFIFLLAFFDLKNGVINYNIKDIWTALFSDTSSIETITIKKVRLPIVLMAMMAGASLATAGLLLQRVTQNPLACPSLLGIEYGTALCVISCYMFLPHVDRSILIGIGLLGSILTFCLMQFIIKIMGATPIGIILIGVTFNTIYYSAIQVLLLAFPYHAQAVLYDLNGSFQGITLYDIKIIFLPILFLMSIALLCARYLNLLDLDELEASALGFSVKKFRFFMLALSILLTTLITSLTGPLLFFGLIIPHLVKPFSHHSFIMLSCMIFGSVFLLFVIFLIQIFSPHIPPPVGSIMILTAMPLLIFVIRRYVSYET